MNCEQIKELLDAYSLGAAEEHEAKALEEHVADCVRCWSSLNEAQRTAASLALSTAIQQAPDSLRRRILAEAERTVSPTAPGLMERLRRLWPIGAGALAVAVTASLAFALILQVEVGDLKDENDELAAEIDSADELLIEQRQLMAVLAAPDVQQISLESRDPTSAATAVYHWSGAAKAGALFCKDLPQLGEGQLYQVWLTTEDGVYAIGSFETWDGVGQLYLNLEDVPARPLAIGMSIEDTPNADQPSEIFLFAELR
ncbi:MAG: anti-sigma factor [Dehalococcoidia bacterium]